MAEPPGDPLLPGLAAGRDEAFAALYARDGAALFRAAVALVGSAADAEDVVQEVFVGLARARAELAAVDNLRAYLFTALRHAAAKAAARRRANRREPLPDAVPAPEPPAGRSAELERALSALPADRRDVIALKIDAGLTFKEIAAVLGVSPNTAASRYRYALAELRAALGGRADD
jgi:RNA polymerase sigma-70 factor (ECF subfamily)